jgi:hypothetical protein
MFELIEIALTRVRQTVDQADDGFLAYLLDMAIIQANKRARSSNDNPEIAVSGPPRHGPSQRDD